MARIYGSSNYGSYLYVDYSIGAQNIAGNYTDVSWTVGVHWGTYNFNIHDARVFMGTSSGGSVGGTTSTGLYNSGWPISGAASNKDWPFWGGTTRVYHNSSGGGNITFNGNAWWDYPSYFKSNLSATIGLPTIPRYPSPPSTPTISNISSTHVDVSFTDGSNGGTPIDSREIGYGTDPYTAATFVSSDGSTTISGLSPGTTYYFWARTHNAAGYSGWSGRASAVTFRVPDATSAPVLSNITQVSVVAAFLANGDGGTPITGYQVGWNTSNTSPSSTVDTASLSKTVLGLAPATLYYFWVRAQNSVGWGPWSSVNSITTIAGAYVKVGAIWKSAVPYVRVGGVWKLARPWSRNAGTWTEST